MQINPNSNSDQAGLFLIAYLEVDMTNKVQ